MNRLQQCCKLLWTLGNSNKSNRQWPDEWGWYNGNATFLYVCITNLFEWLHFALKSLILNASSSSSSSERIFTFENGQLSMWFVALEKKLERVEINHLVKGAIGLFCSFCRPFFPSNIFSPHYCSQIFHDVIESDQNDHIILLYDVRWYKVLLQSAKSKISINWNVYDR